MNAIHRWWKFNLVGAMGMVLQLDILSLLNRWAPHHYIFTSTAAVEITLLHNFVWHLQYTWLDRRGTSAVSFQFLKFHLSNGLVSLLGNVVLMRILVREVRFPVLAANCVAILSCSVVNFCLGNRWVFGKGAQKIRNVDCEGHFAQR